MAIYFWSIRIPGHYGVVGMRERANKIRAKLSIRSITNGGTTIELAVPAAVAYFTIPTWRPVAAIFSGSFLGD
jgi:hypothetical protein